MTELLITDLYPSAAIDSIRRSYIWLRKKADEERAIRKALDRLVQGETGKPMEPEQAISFLRSRVAEERQIIAGREKKFCAHLTTFLSGRRYLAVEQLPPPENLEEAISILACYPTITVVDVDAYMPVLRIIDEHIRYLIPTHGQAAASYIRTRTARFAECVERWPDGEAQFIPGADKFFRERRYEQSERLWVRTQKSGFQSEREQCARIA